jgi:hypothetical protein
MIVEDRLFSGWPSLGLFSKAGKQSAIQYVFDSCITTAAVLPAIFALSYLLNNPCAGVSWWRMVVHLSEGCCGWKVQGCNTWMTAASKRLPTFFEIWRIAWLATATFDWY